MSAASRLESLERRLKADPASVAFAALADEYRRSGRLGEAVEVARAGLERHPGYASARVTLGRALHDLGRLEEARTELETVLGFAPENLAAIRGLADIHRELGDRAGTLDYLQRALTLAPLDAELRDAIADTEQRMAVEPAALVPPAEAVPEVPHPEAPLVEVPQAAEPHAEVPETALLEEADSDFGELPGFEPPFDLPMSAAVVDEPADTPAAEVELGTGRLAVDALGPGLDAGFGPVSADLQAGEPAADEGMVEPETAAPAPPPFAPAPRSGPESPEHAGSADGGGRSETLRRQEAALEHFLAQILKERERRAS